MRKRHAEPAAPPAPHPDASLTVSEVAARWRVGRHTVTALIRSGRLQAFKAGERQFRIRLVEVERYEPCLSG